MDEINAKEIDKLIELCHIECSEDEKKNLQQDLSTILHYVTELDQVDTNGVEPCYRVLQTLKNVMREDTTGELLSRDLFLANVPSHVGGLIRVPPVIKSS